MLLVFSATISGGNLRVKLSFDRTTVCQVEMAVGSVSYVKSKANNVCMCRASCSWIYSTMCRDVDDLQVEMLRFGRRQFGRT